MSLKITIYNTWDYIPRLTAEGDKAAILDWNGEYHKGDEIRFDGLQRGHFYVVNVDAAVGAALIYADREDVIYPVPFYEAKTAYNPLSFWGCRHLTTIRDAYEWEVASYRNLALNPFDQHGVEGIYPHASSNSLDWGPSVFYPRNAIDGVVAPVGHGEWPHGSFGINGRADAAFTLEFGRPVDIDRIHLYTRADFPHDNWWTSATLVFSDGSALPFTMEKLVTEPHVLENLNKKGITWLRLENLVMSDEPARFPALSQIEVYGTEAQ